MIESSYWAGFFDGEGCVGAYIVKRENNQPKMHFYVGVNQSGDPAVLYMLKSQYGGNIRFTGYKKQEPQRRPYHAWSINGDMAEDFLSDIMPFLVKKRDEVAVYLALRRIVKTRGNKVSDEEWQERERLCQIMRDLKRQLPASTLDKTA